MGAIYIWLWLMMLNTTFNNILVISWQSVLLVEETGVPGKKTPTWHKSLTNLNYSYDQITLIYLYLFLLVKAMFLSSVLNTDQTSTLLPLLNIGLWCLVCTEMYIVQVKNIVINRTYYLFKTDFYSQYKCRTAIKEMFLYFNLCRSVMLDSLSCSLTSMYPFFLKEKKSTDNKLSFKSDLFNSTG